MFYTPKFVQDGKEMEVKENIISLLFTTETKHPRQPMGKLSFLIQKMIPKHWVHSCLCLVILLRSRIKELLFK